MTVKTIIALRDSAGNVAGSVVDDLATAAAESPEKTVAEFFRERNEAVHPALRAVINSWGAGL